MSRIATLVYKLQAAGASSEQIRIARYPRG